MIGQTFSHYRILELLGEGGMGSVYVAEDIHLGRKVAIKFPAVTRDEHHYRARFLREARAVSMLNHPNIAAIYDYGETESGQPFIVMELVKGPTLGELLHNHGLTIERAVEIIESVAEALSEAHAKQIVHRDIKPTNVVINERDVPKVLDFGLAKQTGEEHTPAADPEARTLLATKTRSGAVVGTPLYLSPEQAMGARVDPRSDIFALGALLYECITGRPAFDGESVIEIVAKVIHVDPQPPSSINPNVPLELDRIALKAVQKRPDARYQSVTELIADLRAAKAGMPSTGPTATVQIQRAPGTFGASALTTLSAKLWQPKLSVIALLAVVGVIVLAFLVTPRIWRARPHQLAPAARQYYEEGTNALREGTYYKASRALQRAVSIDDRYALAHARLAEAWTELDYTERAKDEVIQANSLPDRSVLPQLESLQLKAVTDTVKRDFAGAIKSYTEIVSQIPESEKAYAFVDLGRAYEKNEEIDKAIENYLEATNRAPQYAAAYLRVGILYGRRRDFVSALTTFDKAESLYRDLSNYEGLAEILYQRGYLYGQMGKLADAHEHLKKTLEITRTTANSYQQIRALLQLSNILYGEGNTEQAKQSATQAIELARSEEIENLATQGLIELGDACFQRREYAEAEQYLHQALKFAQQNKGRRNAALALLSLARMSVQRDENDAGLQYIEQALPFFQQGAYSKEVSQCLLLRGRAHLQKGDFAAARQDFDRQLEVAKGIKDPSQLATAHLLVGSLLADQELYPEALKHFNNSYTLYKSLGNRLNIGYSLLNRSDMLWRLGNYPEARAGLEQIPPEADHLDSQYRQVLMARSKLIEAQMALSELRPGDAKANAAEAVKLAGTEIKRAAVEARSALGLAQALTGAASEAKLTSEKAVELATNENDGRLLARSTLALAEVMLERGDGQRSLTAALKALETFAQSGLSESVWRAWLVAGRAARRLNDPRTQEYFSQADRALAALQQKWEAEAFNSYLNRPDIQLYRKQLGEASTAPH
jgi:tetratricopeptide (TPR) repeat protein/tRNA A-37 threonylcarbamoyl transferase component Bud32